LVIGYLKWFFKISLIKLSTYNTYSLFGNLNDTNLEYLFVKRVSVGSANYYG
jgi:hypothetical protein